MSEQAAKKAALRREALKKRIWCGAKAFAFGWMLWILVVAGVGLSGGISSIGQFGDSMAFVGSIATALALLVAAYSMLLQREDIDHQIAEMRGSREAAEDLAAAQKADTRARRIDALLRITRETLTWVEGTIAAGSIKLDSARQVQREISFAGRAQGPEWDKVCGDVAEHDGRLMKLRNNFIAHRVRLENAEMSLVATMAADAGDAELGVLAKDVLNARNEWRELLDGPI